MLVVCALVLAAGCTGPATDEAPPADEGFAMRSERVDTDGDGATDALRWTLIASKQPIPREDVRVERDGTPTPVRGFGNASTWQPGTSVLVDCPEGTHEYRLLVGGDEAQVLVETCGGPPPVAPPFFSSNLTAVEHGQVDTIQLTLTSGGPADVDELTARLGNHTVGFYQDPFKAREVQRPIPNGTTVYLPCVPGEEELNITWRDRALPELRVPGCEAHRPGVDAPVAVQSLDADGDGARDGWRLSLTRPGGSPFALANVSATWDGEPAALNGTARGPPPDPWTPGEPLTAWCPAEGTPRFELRVHGRLAGARVAACEPAPGRPLIDVNLTRAGEEELNATLSFSHPGALAFANLTANASGLPEEGEWAVGETVTLGCPGGELVVRYQDRRAFRGPAPC